MSIIDGELASRTSSDPEVKALVLWLKSVPVDQNTIDKVNSSFFLIPEAAWYYSYTHCVD